MTIDNAASTDRVYVGRETTSRERTGSASSWAVPITIWVLSRLLLTYLGHSASSLLQSPGIRGNRIVLPHSDPLASLWAWIAPWFRFDAAWYVGVAQHGYHWGALGQANTNFMPLYPVLIRLLQPITLGSPWFAALLIANLAALGALLVLWRWALVYGDAAYGLRVLLLVTIFPFALFFAAPYAEPLFLLLAVAAFLFAERGQWSLAIGAAALSTVTRPVGVAVVVGLVLLAWQRGDRRHAGLACLAILPLAAFSAYLAVAFGHPLAFLTYHSYPWVPPHGGIWTTITSQFHTKLSPFDRIDAAVALIFLVAAVAVWRRFGAGYAAYVAIGVLLPLVHGLVSMERYVIVLFPAMALWARWHHPLARWSVFTVSLLLFVMASVMFAAGYSIF